MVEQKTLNLLVQGSNPCKPISFHADCMEEVEQVDASYLTDSQPSDDEDLDDEDTLPVHKKQRK